MKNFLLLGSIFLIALFLRLVSLSNIPNGLQLDELNAGYQGYKIIATGSDIYGNHLPFYVDRFGDYRAGGIFYLSGLSTFFLGFNNFAVRFPIALIGALTVIPLFFLTRTIGKNTPIAILSTMLLAISPWHIVTSRATSESLMSVFLIVLATFCLLIGIEKRKKYLFLCSFLSYIFSYFFYPSPRVFIPIFLCLCVIIFWFQRLQRKTYLSVLFLFLAVVVVTIGVTFTKFGTGRFNQTSIFSNTGVLTHIKALNDSDHGNVTSARIFHNKAVVYFQTFVNQYFSYFSTEYLYVKGGLPNRYVVPEMGLFYYIEFPLFFLGFYFLIKQRNPFFFIPIIWLVAAPLGASLTLEDSPNIQRTTLMMVPFFIIEAYGIYYSYLNLKGVMQVAFSSFIIFAFLLQFIYFWHLYFIHSPSFISFERNDGNDRLFSYLKTVDKNFDKVYISSHEDLAMYYLFDTNNRSQLLSTTRKAYAGGYTDDKYIFIPDDCPSHFSARLSKGEKGLFIDDGNCTPDSSVSEIHSIVRKDDTTAYIISTKK